MIKNIYKSYVTTVIGILLSVILIVTHLVKSYRDGKKHVVELEILTRTLEGTRKAYDIKERSTD